MHQAGNPFRQTLHTSKRGLIFNYPKSAQSSGPANHCVAGKPASACKIQHVWDACPSLLHRETTTSSFLMIS